MNDRSKNGVHTNKQINKLTKRHIQGLILSWSPTKNSCHIFADIWSYRYMVIKKNFRFCFRGRQFFSLQVLLDCHYSDFDPIFRILFANEHKLVLVSSAEYEPCLLNPLRSPPLALIVKEIHIWVFFKKVFFPRGGNQMVYKTLWHPSLSFFHGKIT